jgi:hypothetical protein
MGQFLRRLRLQFFTLGSHIQYSFAILQILRHHPPDRTLFSFTVWQLYYRLDVGTCWHNVIDNLERHKISSSKLISVIGCAEGSSLTYHRRFGNIVNLRNRSYIRPPLLYDRAVLDLVLTHILISVEQVYCDHIIT